MSKEVKRYTPLVGLARNAKLRRMEMQCDPRWVLDLAAERDALLAERDRLAAENERLARDARNDSIAYRAVIERQEELRAEVEALKKDAERLDRLDIECEAYGCEGIHEGNRWMIDGPFRTVRDAIDAAMQGDQQ